MPMPGDRVRVMFRDGNVIEGKLLGYYIKFFIYVYAVIELDNSKRVHVCVNDATVECFETI